MVTIFALNYNFKDMADANDEQSASLLVMVEVNLGH